MSINDGSMDWADNPQWFTYNEITGRYELTDEAPEEAIKSFEKYKKNNKYPN